MKKTLFALAASALLALPVVADARGTKSGAVNLKQNIGQGLTVGGKMTCSSLKMNAETGFKIDGATSAKIDQGITQLGEIGGDLTRSKVEMKGISWGDTNLRTSWKKMPGFGL